MPLSVFALYRWNPGQSDILSNLLLMLKQGHRRNEMNRLSAMFFQVRLQLPLENRKIYVVPAPASREGARDHALIWAENLATMLNAELLPCLRKENQIHQRELSKEERAERAFSVDEKYSRYCEEVDTALWIFADDIYTTGATALAAHKALGRPPHFEVWVIGYRGLACGPKRDLL
jgi:predicted amidophosphoribosyltransferase